ncbi:hypothetical protein DMNBHIDG_02032 [Candidatus Methanoperedenaceae archaeon GB37]|nr:hypothetical protein DMNBHIDG_02032 [Candidatus Methanoperedenaceae archaeon GB37]
MARFLIAAEELALKNLLNNTLGRGNILEFCPDEPSILERLKSINYDLIVIDMELKNGDGMKLVRIYKIYGTNYSYNCHWSQSHGTGSRDRLKRVLMIL